MAEKSGIDAIYYSYLSRHTKAVIALNKRTGHSFAVCREALVQSKWNQKQALKVLEQKKP